MQTQGHAATRRGALAVAAVAAAAATWPAASAAATTTTPAWACHSSAVSASVAGQDRLDPVVVDRTPCRDAAAGLPNATESLGLAPGLEARTAFATIGSTPAGALPVDSTVGSAAGIEGLSLNTADGTVVIGVDAARSQATASCDGGTPTFAGSSTVAGLTINGQPIVLDKLLQPLTDAISDSPLGDLISIRLNEQVKAADGLTQNAAHIQVLRSAGSAPLADVVIAQSKVSAVGAACDRSQQTGGGDEGAGGKNGSGDGSGNGNGNGTKGSSVNGRRGGCGHLSMHFVKNGRHRLTTRYGKRQVTRGRLINCKGKPIVGAKIDVYHKLKGRKRRLVKTGLKSRPGGKLTLILPLNLTTRKLIFEYRGDRSKRKVSSRVRLRLRVRDHEGHILRGPAPGYRKRF